MQTELKPILRRYAAYFFVWTALGLFMFSQGIVQKVVTNDPNPWWHHLTSWMVGVYVWFLLTPAVLWLGRRFPLARQYWFRRAMIHIALGLAIAIVELATESAILRAIGVFPTIMTSFAATLIFLLVIGFHQAFLMYWMILAVQFGFGWYSRYIEGKQAALRLELRSSQLEGQLTRAHLSALKMQLQPHFLFNTLNTIMVLVRQRKSRDAEEMLGRLSDLLRCVLEDVDTQEIPLRRELEYLQLYLSIEQVRFQDRLRVEIAMDPEVFDASVPHMVLQPIVENAIRHGIGGSSSAGKIRISARRVEGTLEMQVQDDGPGLGPASGGHTSGIGLRNTRARLAQLYGDAASFSLRNDDYRGVVATVILPYRVTTLASETDSMETRAVHNVIG
ncbi:MAG TPA: histidine kinase [Bryobacteraceae bacterium]|jgi:sensor histidine kinase YesM|nr:histidine kinase [Bryobacteraceae bacterium]